MTLSTNNVPISLHNGLTPHLLSKETAQNLMMELLQNELSDICNHPDFQQGLEELKARGMVIPNTVIPFVNRIKGQPALWVNVEGLGLWRIKSSDELNVLLDKYLQRCFAQTPINPPTLQETASKTDRIHEENESLDEVEETDSPSLTDRTRDITDTKPKSSDKRTRKDREKDLKRTCEECERLRRDGVKLNDERIDELEKENDELRKEIDELQERLETSLDDEDRKRLEDRINYLQRRLEQCEQDIRSLKEANRVLKRENRQLRSANRNLHQRLNQALQDQSDLQTFNNFLKRELRHLHEVERELIDSNALVRRLEDELETARRHAPPVEDRDAPAAIPDDEAPRRIAELEEQLEQAKEQFAKAAEEMNQRMHQLQRTAEFQVAELRTKVLLLVGKLTRGIESLHRQLQQARGPELEEALRAQKEQLSAQIEDLENSLAEMESNNNAEIASLRAQLEALQNTNQEQAEQMSFLRASAQTALQERDALLAALKNASELSLTPDPTSRVKELQAQLNTFAEKIPKLVAYAEKLKQANKELQAHLIAAKSNEAEAQQTLREKQEAFEQARRELQVALDKAASEKESEAADFNKRIAELEAALSRSAAEKSQLSTTVDGLLAENRAQAAELDRTRTKAEAAEKAHRELVEALKQLHALHDIPLPDFIPAINALFDRLVALKTKFPGLKNKIAQLTEANEVLRAQLAAATGTGTEAQEALRKQQEEFNKARNELQAALAQAAREKELEAADFNKRIAALEQALKVKTEQLILSEAEKSTLSARVDALLAANQAQGEQLQKEKARADAAERDNEALRARLAQELQLNEEQRLAIEELRKQVAEMDALKAELASQRALLTSTLADKEKLESRNRDLEQQLQQAIKTLTRETDSFAARERELNERLADLEKENAFLSRQKRDQEKALMILRRELAKYKQSAEQLAEVSEAYQAELERNRELAASLDDERRKNRYLQESLGSERAELQKLRDQLSLLPAAGAGAGNQKELEELRAEISQLLDTLEKMTGEKIDDGRASPSLADEEGDASIDATRRNLRLIIEHFKKLVQDLEASKAREEQANFESASKKPQEKEQSHCELHEQQIRLLSEQIAILQEKLQTQALAMDEDIQVANSRAKYNESQYQEKAKEAAAAEERVRSAEARLRMIEESQKEQAAKDKEKLAQLGSENAVLAHDRSSLERQLAESRKAELALQRRMEQQVKDSAAEADARLTRERDYERVRAKLKADAHETLEAAYNRAALAGSALQERVEDSEQREKESADKDQSAIERAERFEAQANALKEQLSAKESEKEELLAELEAQKENVSVGMQTAWEQRGMINARDAEIESLTKQLKEAQHLKMGPVQRRHSFSHLPLASA
ncbi:MAG TPA: hypothetical protein VLG44_05605 [Chlamydiales bacterium]|nr:hypothetical protein [Chlamydiales bacterium]